MRSSIADFARTRHEAPLLPRDGLSIYRAERDAGKRNREVATGLVADLDAKGEVVGFDIDGASRRFDLSTLETIALPVKTTTAA